MTTQVGKAQTQASDQRDFETLKQLLAGVFTLCLKTKGFHWHVTGRHFRDYHLLLDEQAGQIFVMTDDLPNGRPRLGDMRCEVSGTSPVIEGSKMPTTGVFFPGKCFPNFGTIMLS